MRLRAIPVACIVALLAAFVVDLLTPQLFVAAILLDAPIALSSLGGNRRFTDGLVVAALAANVVAGYINGLQDHRHWSAIGVGDRILAGLSIAFVGYLSTTINRSAQRTGRLEAERARAARETRLTAAVEGVRASLSTDIVARAIATEAARLFGATAARFIVRGDRTYTLVARAAATTVEVDEARPAPELASLVERTFGLGDAVAVRSDDALGRLVLERLDAAAVLALPIADRDRRFGVVLVLAADTAAFADTLPIARAFALAAGDALANAHLFAQLAERNTALAERESVIRDLVYALSHDLRTPLAALGMTMRQARGGAYGELPARYGTILETSIAATDDLARLAETLLLVARFESGDRRPDRDRVDLAAIARQIAGELAALAAARAVSLLVEGDAAVETIGDRDDLRRATTNLIANALDHTPPGGAVRVRASAAAGAATLRVSDDGHGVDEATRAQLFTRFTRGASRRGGGSGLGLYIVRRVALECGGTVSYVPNEPRGSVFTLTLPAAA